MFRTSSYRASWPSANAACWRTSALVSFNAAVRPSMARGSRIWPSANAACSRTSASLSFSAMTSASTAAGSRICPSANAACSRTSAFASLSAEISGSMALRSRIWPSANAACSRTLGFVSRSAGSARRRRPGRAAGRARTRPARARRARVVEGAARAVTARWSRIWPSANAACSRTSASVSFSAAMSAVDGARIAQLAEREDRLLAHAAVRVLERGRSAARPRAGRAAGRGRTPPARARRPTRPSAPGPAARRSAGRASARARASPSRALPCRCPSAPPSARRPSAGSRVRPCRALLVARLESVSAWFGAGSDSDPEPHRSRSTLARIDRGANAARNAVDDALCRPADAVCSAPAMPPATAHPGATPWRHRRCTLRPEPAAIAASRVCRGASGS